MKSTLFENIFGGNTKLDTEPWREGLLRLSNNNDHPEFYDIDGNAAGHLNEIILDPATPLDEVPALTEQMNEIGTEYINAAQAESGESLQALGWSEDWYEAPGPVYPEGSPEVRTQVMTPPGEAEAPRPAIFSTHGGGLVMGDVFMDNFVHYYVLTSDSLEEKPVLIQPEYRVAPVHKYPAAIEDCYAALSWAMENHRQLGIDPKRVVIQGLSSGATLTASLAHLIRDRQEFEVAAQVILFGTLDDRPATKSWRLDDAAWNPAKSRRSWQAYLGDNYGRSDLPPYAAAGRGIDFRGLAPAIIHCGERDHSRDDVMRYVQKLLDANVFVDFRLYGGVGHGFAVLDPGIMKEETRRGISKQYYHDLPLQLKAALSGKLPRRTDEVYV